MISPISLPLMVHHTGYSDIFHSKLEDFFDDIGGEDKAILETFDTVAHWVAILVAKRTATFHELIEALMQSPPISSCLESSVDVNQFAQLTTAEDYMDFITGLFQYGLSGCCSE